MNKIVGNDGIRHKNEFFVKYLGAMVIADPVLIIKVKQGRIDGFDGHGGVGWYFLKQVARGRGTYFFAVFEMAIAVGVHNDVLQGKRIVIE